MQPLPAHETKHHAVLSYALPLSPPITLSISQSQCAAPSSTQSSANDPNTSTTQTTGTTLWLSSQLLSVYLLSLPRTRSLHPRALDLGAGTGLTSLTLALLGYNVLSTDVSCIISGVLSQNVTQNTALLENRGSGKIEVRVLDWFTEQTWEDDEGFDLVVTVDTVYEPELARALVATLESVPLKRGAEVLIGVEVREKEIVTETLERLKKSGKLSKVEESRVATLVEWEKSEWDGVEIWRWKRNGRERTQRSKTELRSKSATK